MIKVTVVSAAFRTMAGVGKTSGKPYDMAFQDAWFHTVSKEGEVSPYPQKVEVILPKDNAGKPVPFAPGVYQLAPPSVFVDRSGKLAIEPVLVPLAPPASGTPNATR